MDIKSEIEKIIYSGNEPELIVNRVLLIIKNNYQLNKKGAASIKQTISKEVESWIDEWLDIFPVGVRSGSKLVRSDRSMCLKKMVDLVASSNYRKDEIIEATKEYVDSFKDNYYMYMKCATYFINKDREGSELIAMCDKRKNGIVIESVSTRTEIDSFI